MPYQNLLDWFNSPKVLAVMAGAFGGVMRWVTLRERWQDGLTSVMAGAICAAYIGPLAEPVFRQGLGALLPNGDAGSLSGFLVGLGGTTITAILMNIVKLWGKTIRETDR